jgi:hypothetical protein
MVLAVDSRNASQNFKLTKSRTARTLCEYSYTALNLLAFFLEAVVSRNFTHF